MSHYKPYPAYKESGVEWLGKVPEHWAISSVKWEFSCQLGKMLQPERKGAADIQVPYHKAISVQWERIADEAPEKMWATYGEIETYRIRKNDLLICEGGDVGRSAIYDGYDTEPLIIQNSVHRVRPKKGNLNATLLRLLQSCRSNGWFDVLCSKATIVHLTAEKLGDLAFPVAPSEEQEAIAVHLDRETTRIDTLIAKKTRFIELLKEKRQALITQAVTKGLNPNVKMKDSGVEWLGEVPEYWTVASIKSWFRTSSGGTPDTTKQAEFYTQSGGYPWVRTTDLNNGELWDTEVRITEAALAASACSLLPENTVAVAMYGGEGTIGKFSIFRFPTTINQALCALLPNKHFVPEFVYWYVQHYRPYWMIGAESTRKDPNISQELIRTAPIVRPSFDEQLKISEYLSAVVGRIDLLLGKTERSIELLKERRSALITAAVTGQIDLREVA